MRASRLVNVPCTFATFIVAVTLYATPALTEPLPSETLLSWICANENDPAWGTPGSVPPFWEPMIESGRYIPGAGSTCDLDPVNPFYAGTPIYDRDFTGVHFWAEIWLANNFTPVVPRRVDAEFWSGGDQNPVVFHASATVMVTNAMPGTKYVFDFGTPITFLGPAVLMLKIIYYGPLGDTHVYWDSLTYPTGLRTDTTVGVASQTWGGVKSLYE